MAQYDLLLTQNVASSGYEFSEKYVNLGKGDLLSGIATTKVPTVLAAGTNAYHLVRDDAEATGLKWVAMPDISALHTQNTDTGTTASIFHIQSGTTPIEITWESASKLGIKVDGGTTYADLQAKDGTFNKVTISGTPTAGTTDAATTAYVDNKFGNTAGSLWFKGNILTAGGDITPTAFNALAIYTVGWQYRAGEAGTFKGFVCEVGDILTALVTRNTTGAVNSDWTVSQTNIDGAVVGPASATDNAIAIYNTATGKLIEDSAIVVTGGANIITLTKGTAQIDIAAGAVLNLDTNLTVQTGAVTITGNVAGSTLVLPSGSTTLGTMAAETATNYVLKSLYDANTILYATTDNTPAALTVGEQTLVGRITGGAIAALTPAQIMSVICVTAPADKIGTGITSTLGQIAFDANFFYRCTQSGASAASKWSRSPMATNW
jgi:hypothetical protein